MNTPSKQALRAAERIDHFCFDGYGDVRSEVAAIIDEEFKEMIEVCEVLAAMPYNVTNPEADRLMRKVQAALAGEHPVNER